jgi:hypothetical protein
VGALEILGGVGLLFAKSRKAGAAILIAVMLGALGTHLVAGEYSRLVPPLVLGGLVALSYASRRFA